jgi:hypothetical protein
MTFPLINIKVLRKTSSIIEGKVLEMLKAAIEIQCEAVSLS